MFQSTPKQRAASRANAQKSTGPRTTAGKAASRFNALKHGIFAVHQIMFDETPEDLAELSAEYHEHHNPADSDQRFLVDTLVHYEWRIRRIRRVEAALWQTACNTFIVKNIETTSTCTSGDAFATDSGTFERLQRVANSCERVYYRAHKELERLQEVARAHGLRREKPEAEPEPELESRPEPAPPPQPEQSKPASEPSASFRQNSETSASPAPDPMPATPFAAPDAPQTPLRAASASSRPTDEAPSKPPETA
jgi:hypothetical protein